MIYRRPSANPGKVIIRFEIPGTIWAEKVNLVGDFNEWDEESLPFSRNRQGDWVMELELSVGREYHFRYLFDGTEWTDELQADKFVTNNYGTHDSVVVVEPLTEESDTP